MGTTERFTRREFLRILDVTDKQLTYWEKLRLVSPRKSGSDKFYDFRDLISLRTAKQAGILKGQFRAATLLADSNYFSEHNCRFLLRDQKMQALIPDPHFRSRDARFQGPLNGSGHPRS